MTKTGIFYPWHSLFEAFSGKPVPEIYETTEYDLDYYKKLKYNF